MRFRLEVPASGKIPSANYLAKIIIVINNNINVSRFNGTVPDNPTQNRKIRGGPIYAKDEVLLLCRKNKLELWTDESISDSQKWGMDLPGIATLIASAVQRGTFKCSEWCIRAAWETVGALEVNCIPSAASIRFVFSVPISVSSSRHRYVVTAYRAPRGPGYL